MAMIIENYEGVATSTRARSSNVATIVCSSVHKLITGETITISGMSGTGYNDADVAVTVTSATAFTYANTGTDEGTTGDTGGLVFGGFVWPNNPQAFDATSDNNYQITPIDFQRHHIIISGNGVSPKVTILTGHFNGTSMFTYWRNCTKHFGETTKIKKLYFESDKFYMGIGKQIKRTHASGRTNFIDYVATFESFISILFGETAKTSGTNAGNVKTFVHSITGTVTNGAVDIVISDDVGNQITINASELTTGHTFEYKLVEMVQSGTSTIYVSKFGYVELNGTYTANVRRTAGYGLLQLDPGANISTVTTTNLSSVVKTFRDGYYD